MAARKRIALSLDQKMELIKASSGRSSRQLADQFGIGRTQVQGILKRKAELMEEYDSNNNGARKRACYRSEHEDIDKLTWAWFQRARGLNTPVSGPMIQQQALDYAKELGKVDFRASNGWLTRFKTRHNIGSATLSGERASVDQDDVTSWRQRLPEITKDFAPEDVYNMDETGLFFRALPDKTLAVRGSDCAGGKKAKERLTVVLCVNAVGDFEKPLVIGHAKKPRCFKNLNPHQLPVTWTANKKAWMTTAIFTEWIKKFNRRMRAQGRHVLLLLDNAPSHPQDLNLTHVTLRFLPAGTTSVLQPLDLGIIKTMKGYYRTRLLRAVLSKIETSSSASETAKATSCLDACHWVAAAVKNIRKETVVRCFQKAGLGSQSEDNDPDDDLPLARFLPVALEQLEVDEPMSLDEYEDIDASVPATEDMGAGWEQQLARDFMQERAAAAAEEKEDDTDEDTEQNAAQNSQAIKSYDESLKWTAELKLFAADKGLDSVLQDLMSAEEKIQQAFLKIKTAGRQACLPEFFGPS